MCPITNQTCATCASYEQNQSKELNLDIRNPIDMIAELCRYAVANHALPMQADHGGDIIFATLGMGIDVNAFMEVPCPHNDSKSHVIYALPIFLQDEQGSQDDEPCPFCYEPLAEAKFTCPCAGVHGGPVPCRVCHGYTTTHKHLVCDSCLQDGYRPCATEYCAYEAQDGKDVCAICEENSIFKVKCGAGCKCSSTFSTPTPAPYSSIDGGVTHLCPCCNATYTANASGICNECTIIIESVNDESDLPYPDVDDSAESLVCTPICVMCSTVLNDDVVSEWDEFCKACYHEHTTCRVCGEKPSQNMHDTCHDCEHVLDGILEGM